MNLKGKANHTCSVFVRTGTGSELKLRDVIYIMGCKREKHLVKMDERLN